jgi:tetratricopeptide (TPR) repeat protein
MVQDSVEVPYNIAAIYQAQGRYDEAIPIMRDLLKKTEKADGSYSNSEKATGPCFWSGWARSTATREIIRRRSRLPADYRPWRRR